MTDFCVISLVQSGTVVYDGSSSCTIMTDTASATSVGLSVSIGDQVSDIWLDSSSAVMASSNGIDYWYANAFANEVALDSTVETLTITIELTDEQIVALKNGEDVEIHALDLTARNFATGEFTGTWGSGIGGEI